jgi:hypothetical protein
MSNNLQNRAIRDFLLQRGDDLGDGARALIALGAVADADGAGFGFLRADYEHVGNLLHLGVADFRGQLFVAVVEVHADAVALQSFVNVLGILRHFFADWANFYLNRGEPQRECAGVVLDEDAEETLDGAKQGAMNHERLVASAVFADKFEFETRGKIEVELDGG